MSLTIINFENVKLLDFVILIGDYLFDLDFTFEYVIFDFVILNFFNQFF